MSVATPDDLRAALGCIGHLAPDRRERLERSFRQQIEALKPPPRYAFEPADDGHGWRMGHGSQARVYMPSRGMGGLLIARAAFSRVQPSDELTPQARRDALRRAREWVENTCHIEPLADAMRAIEVRRAGVFWRDHGHILIEPPARVSRVFTGA